MSNNRKPEQKPGQIQSTNDESQAKSTDASNTIARANIGENNVNQLLFQAHAFYNSGQYSAALEICEKAYEIDSFRTDNLLLLGAIHFQLRNFSECVFYNQQCIRVDPSFAEAYGNLGNALKELGDVAAAIQFYLKAVKLKPRFCDAYNNLASAYMQLGQIKESMETYQMALVLNPALVDAHSNLGNLYKAQGNLAAAKTCYLESIRIRPDFAIAWSNLAGVFKDEGQTVTAIAYYKESIRLCPEFADAHSNLGNALKEQNQIADAISSYRNAIKLRPDFAIAHGNLASCYFDIGDYDQAIRTFRYAIQLEPNFPDAFNNLGNALREVSQLDEAIKCYRSALRLKPDHPHAYNNLGNAMKDKGMIKEAIHCYVTSIRLMPRFAAAHSNLGSVLKEQGKLNQALSHFHEAIAIDPMFSDAYSNMGNAYKDLGRLEEAMKCYLTAIKIKPDFADAYSNLASAHKDAGQSVEAIEQYRKALQLKPDFPDAFANLVHSLVFICDWRTRDDDFKRLSEHVQKQLESPGVVPSVQPFHTLVYPLSLKEMLQISQRYATRAKTNVSLSDPYTLFRPKDKSAKIKIGYVSSDIGNHPLAHLMQSVFGLHDTSQFEITCYSLTASDHSQWRHKIESECQRFKDISQLHNSDAAQMIHNDGIHILVNLNGYTKGARNEIFALRPAPIQVSYLGFCGTMGADYIDFMVADKVVIPPEYREFYQEKIIHMPHSYFVTDHKQSARYALDRDRLPTRADYGLSDDKFVFCNFNQLYKIDPRTFDVWMAILKRVPNSILWLLRFPATGEANITMEARKRGVRDDQIVFSDVAPKEEHIRRGYLADMFLDTLCCNAHTTACDILWSGTPLITSPGEKMGARVSASLLTAVGLKEMICNTDAGNSELKDRIIEENYNNKIREYEDLAVALALDSERLFAMRRHLENNRENCALFDTARWVRNLEAGFLAVWNGREAGNELEDIVVVDEEDVLLKPTQPQLLG